MAQWVEGQGLSNERDDDEAQNQFAGEELTDDEDAIEQDEHPIDMDTEEPTEKKKLKREMDKQALIRIELAARTDEDFQDIIKRWNKLDRNRERRERYHEILRSGEEFPLEYGASPFARTFPNSINHVLDKQVREGFFLDVIYNCPYEISDLVTDTNLSRILAGLNEEQKEMLYLLAIRQLSAVKVAEIQGKSDRNIRKVRFALIKKINRMMVDLLNIEEKQKENPSVSPTGHEKYLLKKLNIQYEQEKAAQETKKSNRNKKGKKKNRPDGSGSK